MAKIGLRKMHNLTRIKRALIIILILMIIFNFVAIINMHHKIEDLIDANNVIFEYIERRK